MAGMTKLSYQVDEAALPRYQGLASLPPAVAKDLVLYYGGDYELLATVRRMRSRRCSRGTRTQACGIGDGSP